MFEVHSFIDELRHKYPPPVNNKVQFDDNDIRSFEQAFGAEFPSDFYDFLRVYGHGSFDEYFYIWNPFVHGGLQNFIDQNEQAKENYDYLERDLSSDDGAGGSDWAIDCKFSGQELIVVNGNSKYAEFLRPEKIDPYTRSKIIALGNHYPYEFFPEKEGLISFGRTDDEDFFIRIRNKKTSIVMYSSGYYEFDMGVTEFIDGYLTKKIKLPMMNEESDWTFVAFD